MSGISTFERKTFRVEAVQVTVQNMKTLGNWCGGEFKAPEAPGRRAYVSVPGRGKNLARAYVGDWITKAPETDSCRVYSSKQFAEAFKPILTEDEKRRMVKALVETMLTVNLELAVHSPESIADLYTNKVLSIVS